MIPPRASCVERELLHGCTHGSVNNRLKVFSIVDRVNIETRRQFSGVVLYLLVPLVLSIATPKREEERWIYILVRVWTELATDQMVTILLDKVCHRHLRLIRHQWVMGNLGEN